MKPVVIVASDSSWVEAFEQVRKILTRSLPDDLVAVEHVGSTAVQGLPAKPILDIDVVIKKDSGFDTIKTALEALGYIHEGHKGIVGREAFKRSDETVPFTTPARPAMAQHLYVLEEGAAELKKHLYFRDRLRSDSVVKQAYGELKIQLAKRHRDDREAYTEAKTAFIQNILKTMPK